MTSWYLTKVLRPFGLPCWLRWQRICLPCGRPGFDPWLGKIPWTRERLPTPVFWPREFHGLYSLWSYDKESDTPEQLTSLHFTLRKIPWRRKRQESLHHMGLGEMAWSRLQFWFSDVISEAAFRNTSWCLHGSSEEECQAEDFVQTWLILGTL